MPDPTADDSQKATLANTQEAPPQPPRMLGIGRPIALPRLPPWIRSAEFHEWIRSGGILIAAAWGIYTFVWKDILVPSWQPAHINMEASLTLVTGRPADVDGQEMTLEFRGTNASSRRVYLLPNVWWLSGVERKPSSVLKTRGILSFLKEANQVLEAVPLNYAERSIARMPKELIAVGRLFDDNFIDPGAVVQRSVLVRIPSGYEAAELNMVIPLLTRQPSGILNDRNLVWSVYDPLEEPIPMICQKARGLSKTATKVCQTFGHKTEQELKSYDSRKSTIVMQKQFGLPILPRQ